MECLAIHLNMTALQGFIIGLSGTVIKRVIPYSNIDFVELYFSIHVILKRLPHPLHLGEAAITLRFFPQLSCLWLQDQRTLALSFHLKILDFV